MFDCHLGCIDKFTTFHFLQFVSASPAALTRLQSTLVFIEHDGKNLLPVSRHALTAAKKLGGEVSCIVVGPQCSGPAKETAQISGISKLLVKFWV